MHYLRINALARSLETALTIIREMQAEQRKGLDLAGDIEQLHFQLRIERNLRKGGITRVEQLLSVRASQLRWRFPGIGPKAFREIVETLSNYGLELNRD